MSALLAVNWEWELRGILIVIIAVVVLCGSVYLILGTNMGARLGFLVAFAGLAGWMFLMGAIWWTYGKGLLGPEASRGSRWPDKTIIRDAGSPRRRRRARRDRRRSPDDPTADAARVSRPSCRTTAGRKLDSALPAFQQAGSPATVLHGGVRGVRGRRVHRRQRVRQGRRAVAHASADGRIDFLAFWHKPHYALVEVAPLVPQRTEPGRAPARAVIDTEPPARVRVHDPRPRARSACPPAIITHLVAHHLPDRCAGCCTAATERVAENRVSQGTAGEGLAMGQYLPIVAC